MVFKPLSCVCGKLMIPQRFVMMVMLHLALLNSYQMRVVLNIAITEMVQPANETREFDSCPEFKYTKVDVTGQTYDWPSWLEAFVLYAFYIGYILGNLPAGFLADKLGARHVLGACMLTSVITTLLLPICVIHGGPTAAIWLRAILGIGQGPIFPTISSFLQNWAPYSERGFIGGVAMCGGNLGAFIGNLFTGTIIHATKSWAMPFYIWGLISFLWYMLYLLTVFSKPDTHPFITQEELEYLSKAIVPQKERKFSVPWLRLITSLPIWSIFIGTFGDSYTYFTLVTNLPKYMKDILKLDVQANAAYSALPFLGLWLSTLLFSRMSDYLMNRGWCEILTLRKVYTAIGNVAPSVCTLIAAYLGCTRAGAVTLYVVGLILKAPIYSGVLLNCNDISRNYAGIITSFANGLGSIAGVLGPWVVGYLTPNGTIEEWRLVFWIMFGICVVTTLTFLIFGQAERQPWDFPPEETETDEKEE